MDLKCALLVLVAVVHCVCASLLSPSQAEAAVQDYNQVTDDTEVNLKQLEQALREDIIQELHDLAQYEKHLKTNLFKAQNKKRQLEIRKREPVQCLVNIVSCWRRRR